MRLFLFLSLLSLPALSFGQACTHATLNAPDGDASPNTYSCTTLNITGAVTKTPDGSLSPIIVTVSGDVTISANITVNGGNGFTVTNDGDDGPFGGPGVPTKGGGIDGLEGEWLFGAPNPENGLSSPGVVCNDGGGGAGGFDTPGDTGVDCSGNPSTFSFGGSDWGSTFPLTRGGFSGAAGGAYSNGAFSVGSGGGGGGAIHIISTGGSIVVNSNAKISARGGNGGNALNIGGGGFGGGGGGGSGGVILLDAAVGVTLNGVLDVTGGQGGSSPGGGNGGNGKNGVYRVVVNGVTTIEDTIVTTPVVTNSSISKLKSDISCGTVAKKNENQNLNLMFQMMVGFFLVFQAFFLKTAFSNLIRRSSKLS